MFSFLFCPGGFIGSSWNERLGRLKKDIELRVEGWPTTHSNLVKWDREPPVALLVSDLAQQPFQHCC